MDLWNTGRKRNMKASVAILISGRGSNMRALIEACSNPDFPAKIALVVSNKKSAHGIDIANSLGIQTVCLEHHNFADRNAFEQALNVILNDHKIQIVCLAGFMRLLGEHFVESWKGRMINIHPSLLPAYRGLNTHSRVLEAGENKHGCTVHFVSAKMDAGPIIGQTEVPVLDDDTEASLAKRVLDAEHQLYPDSLARVARGDVTY
jgi:phosphoribosylglycinamide formyltransferase 1